MDNYKFQQAVMTINRYIRKAGLSELSGGILRQWGVTGDESPGELSDIAGEWIHHIKVDKARDYN